MWWNASLQLLEPRVMQRALLGGRPVGFGEQVPRPVEIARVERVFERLQLGDERAERVRDVRLIGQTDVAPDAPCAAGEPRHVAPAGGGQRPGQLAVGDLDGAFWTEQRGQRARDELGQLYY